MSQAETHTIAPIDVKKLARVCLVALAAGILLGVIGPFGSYEMKPLIRYGFWIGAILIGMMIHVPLFYAAAWYGKGHRLATWIWVSLSAVVAALPMTFVVNGIFATLFGATQLDSLGSLYPLVLTISLPMQWLAYLTSSANLPAPVLPLPTALQASEVEAAPLVVTAPIAVPAIFARLPGRIGRDLICLEMEDHYVRIYTALGDAMIHLRMADAETELDGIEGMRVHRSWWVARAAVTGWQRDGKTLTLTLSNGKSAPVARDRQPLVKAAGWLE